MTELYSLEDVSHNTGENGTRCWVVIRDIVYDFTDYLDDVSIKKIKFVIKLKWSKIIKVK